MYPKCIERISRDTNISHKALNLKFTEGWNRLCDYLVEISWNEENND